MNYTAINQRLQEIRSQEDTALAAQARAEYHENFADLFSYKKGGVMYVKVKDMDIAKQYRMLKGITDMLDNNEEDE